MSRADFDTGVPHPARVYNYWLGGKDNYAADREVAEQVLRVMPVMAEVACGCREFLAAVVGHLTVDLGIRQFLDIGTGLPTADNTHQVAQRSAPHARIVYVDNDPIVLAHANALLRSHPSGLCAYVAADARDTRAVLDAASATLDFSQPIAVIMLGLLHFITDEDDPYSLPRRYLDACCPGSYLALSHASSDIGGNGQPQATRRYNARAITPITLRSREQVGRFFDGLDLVPPGITALGQWTPDGEAAATVTALPTYTALAVKP
ncbi:MAG TPA: SAM-dependent methyltransferase [Streptosporangiaceae bacterium]|nr:SAM-dependent methyltransferase [Streptosporangiaceae bacterium]